jgi:hypothetical protein
MIEAPATGQGAAQPVIPVDWWQDVGIFWFIVAQFFEKSKSRHVYLMPSSPLRCLICSSPFHHQFWVFIHAALSLYATFFLVYASFSLLFSILFTLTLSLTFDFEFFILIQILSYRLPRLRILVLKSTRQPPLLSVLQPIFSDCLAFCRVHISNFSWAFHSPVLPTASIQYSRLLHSTLQQPHLSVLQHSFRLSWFSIPVFCRVHIKFSWALYSLFFQPLSIQFPLFWTAHINISWEFCSLFLRLSWFNIPVSWTVHTNNFSWAFYNSFFYIPSIRLLAFTRQPPLLSFLQPIFSTPLTAHIQSRHHVFSR